MMKLFTVLPHTMSASHYENNLPDDVHASELPCTERSTFYCGLACGAFITSAVKSVLKGQDYPKEVGFDFANMIYMVKR